MTSPRCTSRPWKLNVSLKARRYAFGEFVEAMAEHLVAKQLVDIKESACEALAAKDAAKSFKEFNVVDQMIRQTAERLGRSSTDHKTYMHLQDVILQTHLEVQGFCTVRWLSRGDAVSRFCDVLPVLMWMWTKEKGDTEKLATSFKFHYMLYLLADVLHLLNGLNLSFQKQTVRLGELMTVKMLDYPVDWAAAYALFEEKGRKGRKPAK
ncbi:unnamed protein product [Closterium sp. Naga37s-1]|nr:unnamed protein product [Closterium sp. Naga37s-1]